MEEAKEYSLEERLHHVSVWRNGGLLLANYSKAKIETKNARRGRKKLNGGFLPVAISDEPAEAPCQIIIDLPKGIRITVSGSVRAEFIKELPS